MFVAMEMKKRETTCGLGKETEFEVDRHLTWQMIKSKQLSLGGRNSKKPEKGTALWESRPVAVSSEGGEHLGRGGTRELVAQR